MATEALARYYEILDGDASPKYLQAKTKRGKIDLGATEELLWREHESFSAVRDKVGGVALLKLKREIAHRILDKCVLCERRCGSARSRGETGHCGVADAHISSEFLHMGEEPDLVPSYTVFFSGCTFNCVFCQNWDISTRPNSGLHVSPETLARKIENMDMERRRGLRFSRSLSGAARNVNWVGGDPTSNLPYILDVLLRCEATLPQVWNSNMYLTNESMRLLDGVVDVYLTDFKYGNDRCAMRLSNASRYMEVVTRNHLHGRAHAEMIIRHLVLPGHLTCCTRPVLTWISENLRNVKVNVMAQYRPEHRAREFSELGRRLTSAEYDEALQIAEELGLELTY